MEDTASMIPQNYKDNLAQAAEDSESPSPAAKEFLDQLVAEALAKNVGEIVLCSGKIPKK